MQRLLRLPQQLRRKRNSHVGIRLHSVSKETQKKLRKVRRFGGFFLSATN